MYLAPVNDYHQQSATLCGESRLILYHVIGSLKDYPAHPHYLTSMVTPIKLVFASKMTFFRREVYICAADGCKQRADLMRYRDAICTCALCTVGGRAAKSVDLESHDVGHESLHVLVLYFKPKPFNL
ncbi:hypothetical protein EVAR_66552_1 [Eumeta japonica]|uniref:Uncharacterized protein n=1 Tax=Eumeta variegata TaxID=151549 RepID=A0A4C1ZJ93_EUMVA|nr:hypothetical protein EVAR_66552_1 [Eumeta japonica]